MKKKITIIAAVLSVLVVLAVWAIPAFAADPASTPQVNKIRIVTRLLLIQDEAKVDALIGDYILDKGLNLCYHLYYEADLRSFS